MIWRVITSYTQIVNNAYTLYNTSEYYQRLLVEHSVCIIVDSYHP